MLPEREVSGRVIGVELKDRPPLAIGDPARARQELAADLGPHDNQVAPAS